MTGGGRESLRGEVAVVTGGSGGIGSAVCAALAAAGACVAVVGRDAGRVEASVLGAEVAAAARGSAGSAFGLPGVDVRDETAVDAMVQAVLDRCGRLDVLVTAAGVGAVGVGRRALPPPVARLSSAAWEAVLGVNLRGTFLANRAVLRPMLARRRGQIVNVSSARGATAGHAFAAAYCASKFAVIGLSEALADEVAEHGIRVQALFPDAVDTPLIRGTGLGRRGTLAPEVVADVILHLLMMPDDTVLMHPLLAAFPADDGGRHA